MVKNWVDVQLPWLRPALRSRRTMKTWFRCCVALATTLMLMVSTEASSTIGFATFFCAIVALMIPPSLAISVFVMAVFTLLIGMLLGWAWGCAAMASAVSVRSPSLYAQQQRRLQSSLDPNVSPALQAQLALFNGIFLDPRSTAVYGAFLFIGTFVLGVMRAYLPNLALLTIFATIVIDVMCANGPLFPTAVYTIPKALMIPTLFYLAVALASLALIFPESLSHSWLASLRDGFWTPALDLLCLQTEAMGMKPSAHKAWAELNARGNELRTSMVEATDSILPLLGVIDLDFSIGRLGPADLKKIQGELKSLLFRASGLQAFQAIVNDRNKLDFEGDATPMTHSRYQSLQRKLNSREAENGHDLDSLMPVLSSSSSDLRSASESAVKCIMDWLDECNTHRWSAFFSKSSKAQIDERHVKLANQLHQIEDALYDFRNIKRVELVKPFEKFFDPKTKKLISKTDMFASQSLFTCFVFLDTLDAFAERMSKFMEVIIEIDNQRPNSKFWFPGRIAKVKESITSNQFSGTAGPFSMGSANDPTAFNVASTRSSSEATADDEQGPAHNKKEDRTDTPVRNPDALPPKTAFGQLFVGLGAFVQWFGSPQGIFAMRHAIVSIALWIPAVCTSSAFFYYEYKGLWALIMAQTGLALYAGDQIMDFIVRLLGTLIGLLVGMAVWYIGAGTGNGNPYGIVIVTTAFMAPFVLARIAAPLSQIGFWTMIAVTVIFVVGYSWANVHSTVIASAGVGFSLSWKRVMVMVIGYTAAFIVMLFPSPITSRVLVRKTLAAIINETGQIFAGEVEAFLAEEIVTQSGRYEKVKFIQDAGLDDAKVSPKERRVRNIGKRVLAVVTRLKDIHSSLSTAKFDPQLSGVWPSAEYQELFELQARMLGSLVLLMTSFSKLDTKWCSVLVHKTPFLNPNFLSDVFTTVSILSTALMDGTPLPAYLPNLRDRLIYHEFHSSKRASVSMTKLTRAVIAGGQPGNNAFEHGDEKEAEALRMQEPSLSSSEDLLKVKTEEGPVVDEPEEIAETEVIGPVRVDGTSIGIDAEEMTLDMLMDEQLPAHSTAVIALSSLISRIDEIKCIARTLCGEATLKGYDTLQRFYLDQEERAVGLR